MELLSKILISVPLVLLPLASAADSAANGPDKAGRDIPGTVTELWAGFDPRNDPLETEIVREWNSDGLVLRYVRFLIGTFHGKPARMAAYYAFPESAKEKLPAVMHIHGGGQRASLSEAKAMGARGYAVLSVNWGGKPMEDARPGEPNTDWGAVDPTDPAIRSLHGGPKHLYPGQFHPGNSFWFLLAMGCRRGLTFLERQPEVDPMRLGVYGYSMGGNLTMYVTGIDRRVQASVPAWGGAGWYNDPPTTTGELLPPANPKPEDAVFQRTLGFEHYAPLVTCPVLHRSASNDWFGPMDNIYRTMALIKEQPLRYSWVPHEDHRLTAEVAVTMPLLFDQFLRAARPCPKRR